MSQFEDVIEVLKGLQEDVSLKIKTEIDGIIQKLMKENLTESDIIEIQEKIEELSNQDLDFFTRNELINLESYLSNYT